MSKQIAIEWTTAHKLLQAGRACGKGTSSTFRGTLEIGGKRSFVSLLDKKTLVQIEGVEVPAGKWIADYFKDHGFEKRPANNDNRSKVTVPRFAKPGVYRNCYYVDIKAAYPSIYSRLWWDVGFLPDKNLVQRGTMPLSDLASRLMHNKHARNAVVGFALSRGYLQWQDGVANHKKSTGKFFNPQLGWVLWAILGAIAWRVRDAGALYYNTDGAIVDEGNLYNVVRVYDSLGLDWSVKESGDCVVWGVGAYSFHDVHNGRRVGGFPRGFTGASVRLPNVVLCERALKMWLDA